MVPLKHLNHLKPAFILFCSFKKYWPVLQYWNHFNGQLCCITIAHGSWSLTSQINCGEVHGKYLIRTICGSKHCGSHIAGHFKRHPAIDPVGWRQLVNPMTGRPMFGFGSFGQCWFGCCQGICVPKCAGLSRIQIEWPICLESQMAIQGGSAWSFNIPSFHCAKPGRTSPLLSPSISEACWQQGAPHAHRLRTLVRAGGSRWKGRNSMGRTFGS